MTESPDQANRCPLCDRSEGVPFLLDATRAYLHCPVCDFVFVPPAFHLTENEEKARYDFHQNNPNDPGYRKFLAQIVEPMTPLLQPGATGLDFGCGPGPTLSILFKESGFEMDLYDKYFAPHPEVFGKHYDFITTTEVVEHLRLPGQELKRLFDVLKPDGLLGVMTRVRPAAECFEAWYYRNDPTHIGFFSQTTFRWIAQSFEASLLIPSRDVALFRKK